jgi:hypothetical protein
MLSYEQPTTTNNNHKNLETSGSCARTMRKSSEESIVYLFNIIKLNPANNGKFTSFPWTVRPRLYHSIHGSSMELHVHAHLWVVLGGRRLPAVPIHYTLTTMKSTKAILNRMNKINEGPSYERGSPPGVGLRME